MKYFLGIDQGGSKTQVAVCDETGNLVGAATGEAFHFYLDDPENKSTATARRLAEKILNEVGLQWDCLSAVCGGINGVDWPHETAIHEARLREGLDISDATAVNDCIIALRAGTDAPNRCIVCAGTSLNIAVRSASGKEFVYGYYIATRLHGGQALGNATVEAVMETHLGIHPPTALTAALLTHTGCATTEQFFIDTTMRRIPFEPKTLVPTLLKTAVAGDPTARKICDDFATGLAVYVENALTRHIPPAAATDLVCSGGVFKGNGRLLAETLKQTLAPKFPHLRILNARLEPVCGALLMLLDHHHGGTTPPDVTARFEQTCTHHGMTRILGENSISPTISTIQKQKQK